jgi:glycosyltransferase involved in cell wall biosynthesis
VHYRLLGEYSPSIGEYVRDFRKVVLYRLMLLNPALKAVYSLDPFFPEFARRHYSNGAKVQPLRDPAHPNVSVLRGDHLIADRMPRDRINFLLFGYLSERKGTLALLDALRELAPDSGARVGVMLAGRIDPSIRAAVEERIAVLARERPDLWIGREDRRLSAGELEALVQRANVLLAPYQRFVGSSGVLMWAARAGKPLLTQDFGMMGAIVRELGLGVAIDTMRPRAIADAIADMAERGPRQTFDRRAAIEFSAAHTPHAFASAIFETL